jgi:hypothetical protein
MKNKSYFSIFRGSALASRLKRWRHPYTGKILVTLNEHDLSIYLTRRAEQALSLLTQAINVEIQLYFSCMVKKRVLFHLQEVPFKTDAVTPQLNIAFRSIQSDSCNPEEFAAHYPQKKSMDNPATRKMYPRELHIDYIDNNWTGDFLI